MRTLQETASRMKIVDGEIEDLKANLNRSKSNEAELIAGQIIFQRTELLFDDLKNLKVDIEKHFEDVSRRNFAVNRPEAKRRLDLVKSDYLTILDKIEEGHKKIRKLKNNLDNMDDKSHDEDVKKSNSTYVFQCRVSSASGSSSRICKPIVNRPKLTKSWVCNHSKGSSEGSFRIQSPAGPRIPKRPNLESENRNLKKQIKNLQDDFFALWTTYREELKKDKCAQNCDKRYCGVTTPPPGRLSKQGSQKTVTGRLSKQGSQKGDNGRLSKQGSQKGETGRLSKEGSQKKLKNIGPIRADIDIDIKTPRTASQAKDDTAFIGHIDANINASEIKRLTEKIVKSQEFDKTKEKKISLDDLDEIKRLIENPRTSEILDENSFLRRKERTKSLEEIESVLSYKDKEIQKYKDALKSIDKAYKKETERLRTSKTQEVEAAQKLLQKSYEYDELLAQNIKIRKSLDDTSDDLRNLELENEKIAKEKDLISLEKRQLLEETTALANRLHDLQSESEKWLQGEKRLRKLLENERLSHELTKKELDDTKKEYEQRNSQISSFLNEKDVAKGKAAELLLRVDELSKMIKEKDKKNEENEIKVKKLEKEIENVKKHEEKKLCEMSSHLKKLESKNKKLEEKASGPKKEIERLQCQAEEMKKIIASQSEETSKLSQESLKLQYEKLEVSKKYSEAQNQIKHLKNDLECMKSFKKGKDAEFCDLESKYSMVKKERDCAHCRMGELESEFGHLKEVEAQLLEKLQEMEENKINLLQELERTNKALYCEQQSNYELQNRLNQFVSPVSYQVTKVRVCRDKQNDLSRSRSNFRKDCYGILDTDACRNICEGMNEDQQIRYNQYNATVEHDDPPIFAPEFPQELGPPPPSRSHSWKELFDEPESALN